MDSITLGQLAAGAAFLVALIGSLTFLMSRTKAWVLQTVKDEINRLDGKIDENTKRLVEMEEKRGVSHADQSRRMILNFNDELLRHVQHSKESFDQILRDIDGYEDFSRRHPDYPNNQALMAIANIKRCYQTCAEKGTFLS